MRKTVKLLAIVALVGPGALALAQSGPVTAQGDQSPPSSLAEYNGRIIDLAVSWEGAQACRIAEPIAVCFDTEAELDQLPPPEGSSHSLLTDCGSATRLYDGASYGVPVVEIWPRWTVLSLSTYGFSGRTSSYRIGACSAVFYDSSGNVYPGSTGAGASSASMASGWNNRVAQVYLS